VLAIFHPLDKYLAQTKPDLMVVDFATWGAWDAAEKHKVSTHFTDRHCFLGQKPIYS
jgi:hypothetical protein